MPFQSEKKISDLLPDSLIRSNIRWTSDLPGFPVSSESREALVLKYGQKWESVDLLLFKLSSSLTNGSVMGSKY